MKPVIWVPALTVVLAAAAYFFVIDTPSQSGVASGPAGAKVSSEQMFKTVNRINVGARKVWTARIVTQGKEAGLKFSEKWRDQGVDAGPLPALFLRLTATKLDASKSPLSLFLGSDNPINVANVFAGEQTEQFKAMRGDQKPRFFGMSKLEREVGMFVDVATVPGCVTCHNEHVDSPKKDWKLNDIMGAATWMYPKKELNAQEYNDRVRDIYGSIRLAYQDYLDHTAKFAAPIKISTAWPEKGSPVLPDADTFMDAVLAETAGSVVKDVFLGSSGTVK